MMLKKYLTLIERILVSKEEYAVIGNPVTAFVLTKGTGNREVEVPPAFRQTDFASSYESRINQTPAQINPKIEFEEIRENL